MNTLKSEIYYTVPWLTIPLTKEAIQFTLENNTQYRSPTGDTSVNDAFDTMSIDCSNSASVGEPFTINFTDTQLISDRINNLINPPFNEKLSVSTRFFMVFNVNSNDNNEYGYFYNDVFFSTDEFEANNWYNLIDAVKHVKCTNEYVYPGNNAPILYSANVTIDNVSEIPNTITESFNIILSKNFPKNTAIALVVYKKWWETKWSSSYNPVWSYWTMKNIRIK